MADEIAVYNLFARYALANDKPDMQMVEDSFTEDASFTLHIAGAGSIGPLQPRGAIVEFFGAALGAQTDRRRHVASNFEFVDDTHVNAYLTLIVTDNGVTEVKSAGLYETEIAEEGGQLRFRSMVLSLDNGF